MAGYLTAELAETGNQRARWRRFLPALAQPVHHPAKSMLAVGRADRAVIGERQFLDAAELTIMSEIPIAAPQFAGEGVRILERHPGAPGATDMADHDPAFDRVTANKARDFGTRARLRVVKGAAALAVVEGDIPAVAVRAALATAPHQPGKAEADIGGDIGIHS